MRREFQIPPDEHLVYGGAIYDNHARDILADIYQSYIDIAQRVAMPILLTSSTRRANPERIAASRHAARKVNQDWMAFLKAVRGEDSDSIFLGSLMGARGDAYRPQEALSEAEALAFHRAQCQASVEGGADFLIAGVLPALSEARGLARAIGETGRPFIISFIISREGTLLDGTPLGAAIESLDGICPPLCYMVNCVHPSNVRSGLLAEVNCNHPSISRLIGIQANTSKLSPKELNNSTDLRCDGAESLADSMLTLRLNHSFQIFGGCCGTDNTHLQEIALRLSINAASQKGG